MIKTVLLIFTLNAMLLTLVEERLQAAPKPLSVEDIEYLLREGVTVRRVTTLVEEQGVSFGVTESIKERLRKAGADEAVLAAVDRASLVAGHKKSEEERKVRKRIAVPPPPNHPPQIVKRFPDEEALLVQDGKKRSFLATATDVDEEQLIYIWFVDDKKVAEGERFTFAANGAGLHHVRLEVKDPRGLKAKAVWNVTVEALKATPQEASVVEPRLVMFTPHERRLSLFLHQFCSLGVQVEVPGVVEPSLRYHWTVDGQEVSGQETFEFRDQPIGDHEVTETVTAPSGASLSQRWTVEVRGVKDSDDIGPLWWPRVKVFSGGNIVVSPDLPQMTIKGEVRNLDDKRNADNVAVWVIALDKNNQPLSRRLALPTPQPLAPGQVGTFQVSMANQAAIIHFRYELLSASKADEDYQQVMEHLVRRATAAKQKGAWAEAEALYRTAMKVAPPKERLLAEALRELQAARTGGHPSLE